MSGAAQCVSTKLISGTNLTLKITDRLQLGLYPANWETATYRNDENSKFSYAGEARKGRYPDESAFPSF